MIYDLNLSFCKQVLGWNVTHLLVDPEAISYDRNDSCLLKHSSNSKVYQLYEIYKYFTVSVSVYNTTVLRHTETPRFTPKIPEPSI